LNDFLVSSFLRFGYEVSFEALDKSATEILGPYGVVSVVCHEVPVDKGTSESSFLGAGSPLPSIPLHSTVSYCTGAKLLEHGRMKSNDFSKSSRTDYYSYEWRFPCREPNEGRPSHPVRRAGISRPYYHYAFAMLLGSTLFVTFSRMWDSLSSWVDNRSSFILI
ncbi:hypothetical protein ACB092_12G073700, partial [Castanea dentata]